MKLKMKLVAILFLLAVQALAVPQLINYQGQLTSPTGTPLDTTVSIAFRIYSASSGGTLVWSETHPSVVVTDGLFNVSLGSIAGLPDLFATPCWLGITVGNNSEMVPREQIVSVANAYRVGTVDGASGGYITSDIIINNKLNVGSGNTNTGSFANVHGQNNVASADYATVSGGHLNHARGLYSVVGGGGGPFESDSNSAIGDHSTVPGGIGNIATVDYATVGGGQYNIASGFEATVGGGVTNNASGGSATVGGGSGNSASGGAATVGGGAGNSASLSYATVGGGLSNEASGSSAFVGGGNQNIASGLRSTVPGGSNNTASGDNTFAAGQNTTAAGDNSIALGTNVSVSADSAFAWSDGSGPLFSIGSDNTFNLKANAGFRFWTTANHGDDIGARLPANSSAWTTLSDSTRKHRYGLVDAQEVLSKVCQLPIESWSYRADPEGYRHISPMAQDFWNAFHLGDDSLSISTIDPSGVLFAAVQELAKQNAALAAEIVELKNLVQQLVTASHR
jgi:hypothetical protein